jgi:hypothetical protein
MNDATGPSEVMLAEHRAKRLSVAVWILAILLCATLLLSFVVIRALSTAPSGFSRLSSAEQIRSASVIAFADWHNLRNREENAGHSILLQDWRRVPARQPAA